MDIVNQSNCLDGTFCAAFFSALEADPLVPEERSIDDRIAAARAEVAGIARCQSRQELESKPEGEEDI